MSFASPKVRNSFNLDNNNYITSFAYSEYLGPNQNGLSTDIDVHLVSTPQESIFEELTHVSFDFNSPNVEDLGEGVYTYSELREPYTFSKAYLIVKSESKDETKMLRARSGKIIVKKKKNGNYKILYNLLLENGSPLTGSYSGLIGQW